MKPEPRELSDLYCDKITSKFNQHITSMTVGPTGSGKSSFNIRLGYETAIKVSEKMGGEWEDYFNVDHIGIITKEEIFRVMSISKKYAFLMLDDIGVGWNSRKWQDDFNVVLNDILQTFRTDNTALALTLPDSFLIDKVPRSLIHFFIEMDMAVFEKGVTVAKVFEVVRKPRQNKIFFQYPRGKSKFMRYIGKLPPQGLIDEYEEKRKFIGKELKAQRLEDFRLKMEMMNGEENSEPKVTKKDRVQELIRDVDAGVYDTLKHAVQEHNSENPKWKITTSYASKVKCGAV